MFHNGTSVSAPADQTVGNYLLHSAPSPGESQQDGTARAPADQSAISSPLQAHRRWPAVSGDSLTQIS